MSLGWETTAEDVMNVARVRFGQAITEERAKEILDGLDTNEIENEALRGGDMEQQTEYSYDEIARQIREGKEL